MNTVDKLLRNSKCWIRFELGLVDIKPKEAYLKEVRDRTFKLFTSLFDANDDICLVARISHPVNDKKSDQPRMSRFLKNKREIQKLTHTLIPYEYDPTDTDFVTHEYKLCTKVKDIRIAYLIEACSNKDYGFKPKITDNLYVVNLTKNLLFNMYDDRGCDVMSQDKEMLSSAYHTFRSWILDYNRIEIDETFQEGLYGINETDEEKQQRLECNEQKVKETGIDLYKVNTCVITHTLNIPAAFKKDCLNEMNQTGFIITSDEEHVYATKTEALALIDYQSELMSLYAKKYKGDYQFWTAERAF